MIKLWEALISWVVWWGKPEFAAFWSESSQRYIAHWVPPICFCLTQAQLQSPKFSCIHCTSSRTAATSTNSKLLLGGASASSLCWLGAGEVAVHDTGAGKQLKRMAVPCMVDSAWFTALRGNITSKEKSAIKALQILQMLEQQTELSPPTYLNFIVQLSRLVPLLASLSAAYIVTVCLLPYALCRFWQHFFFSRENQKTNKYVIISSGWGIYYPSLPVRLKK